MGDGIKIEVRRRHADGHLASDPPPGLLLSLGDGSAVDLPEKVIDGIAERIAGKMLQRRVIQPEDQSFSAARIVREILGNPEAIKEEIAHAERQNQQAQEARDVKI